MGGCHNSKRVFVWSERLKQIPSDPEIPTGANEIINFQLEGVLETSCQLLLTSKKVSEDRQQIWKCCWILLGAYFSYFAGGSCSADTLRSTSARTAVRCIHCATGYEIRGHISLPLLTGFSSNLNSTAYPDHMAICQTKAIVLLYKNYCQL